MLKENHQNLACEFAEEIVSYLYDEMIAAEKSRFETHLDGCSNCSDEIAGFGLVRSEIVNWKAKDFAPLATPIIEIPFPEKAKPVVIKEVSRPWYVAVRDYFTLSPVWMTATSAMAVLAICAGLFFFTVNSLKDVGNEVVDQETPTNKPVSSPTTEVKIAENKESNPIQPKPDSPEKSSTSPNISSAPKSAPAPTKITDREVVKPQNSTVKKNLTTTNKVNKLPKRNSAPTLKGDEDEDDALRLSDIFNEIGSR